MAGLLFGPGFGVWGPKRDPKRRPFLDLVLVAGLVFGFHFGGRFPFWTLFGRLGDRFLNPFWRGARFLDLVLGS